MKKYYQFSKKVDNIIATIDYNKKQIDGSTDDVLDLGNLQQKFQSFGWKVIEIPEGNNINAIVNVFSYLIYAYIRCSK